MKIIFLHYENIPPLDIPDKNLLGIFDISTRQADESTIKQGLDAARKDWLRVMKVGSVASAAAFLCSNEASFITAVEFPVDGGCLRMGSEGLGETSSFAGLK
jgi:NAD(P)-dependent dehydrogenase (short-subunit alcohol dehydrogenase family)